MRRTASSRFALSAISNPYFGELLRGGASVDDAYWAMVRTDIDAGRFGIGYLVNVNPILLRIDRMSLRLLSAWEAIRYPGRLFRGARP